MEDVVFETKGAIGVIMLNRPKALNSLTRDMAVAITHQLDQWAEDDAVGAVIIKAVEGSRAFCAGGDIKALHGARDDGNAAGKDFFRNEYTMNARIKRFPKPYVALVDGIVMGGGFGLSAHGSHRVAGDNVTFAMPETGIGLYPDVGGTYVLPRLRDHLGVYLALTGVRLKSDDYVYSGLGTHRASSGSLAAIENDLMSADYETDAFAAVDAVIEKYARPVDEAPLTAVKSDIARLFAKPTLEAIFDALETDDSAFAKQTLETLSRMSPTSMKITFEALAVGADQSFEDSMRMEFRISWHILEAHDFYEGVRALLVDKDNEPQWAPASLDGVGDDMIDAYFMPLGVDELHLPDGREAAA